MYHDYYDYKKIAMHEFYEDEMQRHKENAIQLISSVAHSQQECVLKILAYSYFEEHADAIKLAHSLNLCKLEFLAVIEDYDGFKAEYIRDQELAQNF